MRSSNGIRTCAPVIQFSSVTEERVCLVFELEPGRDELALAGRFPFISLQPKKEDEAICPGNAIGQMPLAAR